MTFHHPGPGSASGSASSSSSGYFLTSPFGDTMHTKVFVGGLAWETKSKTLRSHFVQFGEILEAVVITDKNIGRSKGCGFVTYRDPEAAKKACEDSSLIIVGRQANCNLASHGRSRPALPFGVHPRRVVPFVGGVPVQRWPCFGISTHQQPVHFSHQQGFPYPQYCYNPYGLQYIFPQNGYNPYAGHDYLQVYGFSGAGYTMPHGPIVQLSEPNVTGMAGTPRSVMQAHFPAGFLANIPAQPHIVVHAHSPQFVQGSGSDRTPV